MIGSSHHFTPIVLRQSFSFASLVIWNKFQSPCLCTCLNLLACRLTKCQPCRNWKLKIEARSRKMMRLSYRFAPIVLWQTFTSFIGEIVQAHFPLPLHLHNHFNMLVCEVPAEFAKQMKMKIESWKLLHFKISLYFIIDNVLKIKPVEVY